MRFLVTAKPVLDRGAVRRELDPARDRVRRKELVRLEQRGPATVELPESAQRGRKGHTHVDLAFVAGGQ